MNINLSYASVIVLIIFLSSCFKDVPITEVLINNSNIYVPPVLNSNSSDSTLKLISIELKDNSVNKFTNYQIRNILSSNYHLGFPDFTKFNDTWFISFRYSDGHITDKSGYAVIYKSTDLINWEFEQIFTQNGFDIRDPKLLVADNKLFVHFNSTTINPYGETRNDYISEYNLNTGTWNKAIKINKNTNLKSWFWRISYFEGSFYTAGYSQGQLKLYKSPNGTNFIEIYDFNSEKYLTEATLRFYNKKAYILIRVSKDETLFGVADEKDLTNWSFKNLPIIEIGGPNFLFYEDFVLLSGRNINTTSLYYYNIKDELLRDFKIYFPSGFDTGYPGMYIENDKLYLLFYSAGDPLNKNSINLAIVDLSNTIFSFI